MFTMTVSKRNYFDSRLITAKVAEANRQIFNRFGGYVRKVAKRSIKQAPKIDVATGKQLGRGRRRAGIVTRDAIAAPGKPPYAHIGVVGRMLSYAYDDSTHSEVIGPELYGKGTLKQLEEGGEITIGPSGRRKSRRATLRAHPFMVPAFMLGLQQLPGWYRDSVK